jgi:hypothetical protein
MIKDVALTKEKPKYMLKSFYPCYNIIAWNKAGFAALRLFLFLVTTWTLNGVHTNRIYFRIRITHVPFLPSLIHTVTELFNICFVNATPLIIFADYENKVYFKIYSCERSRLLRRVSRFNRIVSMVIGFTSTYAISAYHHFQQYFSYIVTVSFIAGGNRIIPAICRKSLKTLSHNVVSSTPHHERNSNSSQR